MSTNMVKAAVNVRRNVENAGNVNSLSYMIKSRSFFLSSAVHCAAVPCAAQECLAELAVLYSKGQKARQKYFESLR